MAMENKRIIQLSTERTTLGDDDYTIVDSDTNGTAKYRLSRLKETDTTLSVSGMAADAAATGQAINAETQARTQAVAAETQARQQAISAESQARAAADTALGNDVDDLKSAINDAYDMLESETYDGVLYNHRFSSAGGDVSKVKLINGAKYQAINTSASTDGNVTVNVGGRKTADETSTALGTIYNALPVEITPTEDFEYLAIWSNGASTIELTLVSGVRKELNELKSGVEEINDALEAEQKQTLTLKSLNYDIVDGEYIRQGVVYESTAYQHYRHTTFIDVSTFKKIIVTAEGEYSNDMVGFYDSNKNYISSINTNTTITLQEISIPSNAKYVIVCSNDKAFEPFVGAYLPIVNDILVSKTASKSWLLIGDSLTDETNNTATKRYFEWLKEPSCTTTNIAVSGSGYLRNNGGSTNNFVSKVDGLTGNEGYDIVSVFGGINDSGNFDEYPLGNFGDTTPTTYYGAIYYVFNSLITKFPTAFIFAITPSVPDYRHGANNGCDQLADAIKEVCRWLKVPVADINATCGLRPWITGNQSKYYYDGVHPNAEGHKLIANSVRGVFQYMID